MEAAHLTIQTTPTAPEVVALGEEDRGEWHGLLMKLFGNGTKKRTV